MQGGHVSGLRVSFLGYRRRDVDRPMRAMSAPKTWQGRRVVLAAFCCQGFKDLCDSEA